MNMQLSDLFSSEKIKESKFDLSRIKQSHEKLAATLNDVGGQAVARAKIVPDGVNLFKIEAGSRSITVNKLEGIVLYSHAANAWFSTNESENKPPICSSMDGVTGIVNGTGECKDCSSCKYNMFGSDGGSGKACKNMRRIYLACEGVPVPVMLTLPPTSLELWKYYATMDVASIGFSLNEIVTSFELEKVKSNSGKNYSIIVLKIVGSVDKGTAEFTKLLGDSLAAHNKPMLESADYNTVREIPEATETTKTVSEFVDSTAFNSVMNEMPVEDDLPFSDIEDVDIDDL